MYLKGGKLTQTEYSLVFSLKHFPLSKQQRAGQLGYCLVSMRVATSAQIAMSKAFIREPILFQAFMSLDSRQVSKYPNFKNPCLLQTCGYSKNQLLLKNCSTQTYDATQYIYKKNEENVIQMQGQKSIKVN